jgi:small acid-soluble spore protein A (major alpha-type SASP)
MTNTNHFKNVSTQVALEMLKRETAAEMGVELGANTTSRMNGAVGGRVTQKLIALGKMNLEQMMHDQGVGNVEVTQIIEQNDNQLH